MIVSRDAGRFEFARFHGTDFTKRDAHFHAKLANFSHDLENAVEFFRAVTYAPPGRAHAESRRALCPRALGHIDNSLDRQ